MKFKIKKKHIYIALCILLIVLVSFLSYTLSQLNLNQNYKEYRDLDLKDLPYSLRYPVDWRVEESISQDPFTSSIEIRKSNNFYITIILNSKKEVLEQECITGGCETISTLIKNELVVELVEYDGVKICRTNHYDFYGLKGMASQVLLGTCKNDDTSIGYKKLSFVGNTNKYQIQIYYTFNKEIDLGNIDSDTQVDLNEADNIIRSLKIR